MSPQKHTRGFWPTLGRAAALTLLAAVCAVAANLVHPRRIPWVQDWSNRMEAAAMKLGVRLADTDSSYLIYEEGEYLIFDARPPIDFELAHIPGAYSLHSDVFDEAILEYLPMLFPEQPLLIYCSGETCDESLLVTEYLLEQGFTNLVLYAGGMEAWVAAGHPTEEGL